MFYVWFDALLNYYTALGYARTGEDLTARFWPPSFHLIGKDILKFHTVFWPALLLAAGLELPRHVFVHGFLLGADGRKMSKSLGNVLDPFAVIEDLGTDALRFYLMRDVAFGADGTVGMDAVRSRYESELANEYGNLASRTTAMIVRYREGTVPATDPEPGLVPEFDAWPARSAGCSTEPRRPRRSSSSGSGCGGSTATSRSEHHGCWLAIPIARRSSTRRS